MRRRAVNERDWSERVDLRRVRATFAKAPLESAAASHDFVDSRERRTRSRCACATSGASRARHQNSRGPDAARGGSCSASLRFVASSSQFIRSRVFSDMLRTTRRSGSRSQREPKRPASHSTTSKDSFAFTTQAKSACSCTKGSRDPSSTSRRFSNPSTPREGVKRDRKDMDIRTQDRFGLCAFDRGFIGRRLRLVSKQRRAHRKQSCGDALASGARRARATSR